MKATAAPVFANIALEDLTPSPLNPRRSIPAEQLQELAASIRQKGVLQPVLVRPGKNGSKYELVAGHRRFGAAKLAEIASLPAVVRDLSDQEVLEIQVIENLQRSDLHPLEEAAGYQKLMAIAKYDVARVAEKIGRSVKYVYDRVKLLQLTAEAKKLFLDGKITAGHAILLARLSAKDQARAIDVDNRDALFESERLLFHPNDDNGPAGDHFKPRSVRELAGWIDRNCRMEAKDVDPMLFPESALAVQDQRKVVPITHANFIPPEARTATRTYFPRSWKRADGTQKSKTCEYSVMGFVVAGPARGEAYEVCVNKDRCEVHWGTEIRARRKRASQTPGANGKASKAQPAEKREDPKLQQALQRAREDAVDAIELAVIEAAAKASVTTVMRALLKAESYKARTYCARQKLKIGSVYAWIEKASQGHLQAALAYSSLEYGDEIAQAFDIDADRIQKEHADRARAALKAATPPQTSAATKPAAKKKGKRRV